MKSNEKHIDPAEVRLDRFAGDVFNGREDNLGYPMNQKSALIGFYRWFGGSGLNLAMVNNCGDPFDATGHQLKLNTIAFEREVIQMLGPRYGFDPDDLWGIITFSGTDGNNHGIYFGVNYIRKKTGEKPVLYVSDSAHYSSRRLGDLQGLEIRLVPSDVHGCMIPEELDKAIVPDKPALVVYAIGTTFKGGIDDMKALNAVFDKYPNMTVYRHIDAALFGGYLPYIECNDILDRRVNPYDSIAVSGHKFFGMDEPAGFFISTMDVRNNQDPYEVTYLNASMPMISCSRSAMSPLKFWWILQHTSIEDFKKQTETMLENAAWLKEELVKMGWDAWLEPMSNTVYFRQPPAEVVKKYDLAPDHDERLGGDLCHIVVMQHASKIVLQRFLDDVRSACTLDR
jgi:histidine decarboxylase